MDVIVAMRSVRDEDGDASLVKHVVTDAAEHRSDASKPSCAQQNCVVVAGPGRRDDLRSGLAPAKFSRNWNFIRNPFDRVAQRPLGSLVKFALEGRCIGGLRSPTPRFRRYANQG